MNQNVCNMTYEERLKYEIEEEKAMREQEREIFICYIKKLEEELAKRS